MAESKAIHSVILDAGPILQNDPSISSLLAVSEAIYSVPSVISEIRDATARARLETTLLPFLKLRNPSAASLKTVTAFARRTGDYEVLSRVDLQILALAYELECERNGGDWRLRSTPGQKKVNGAPPKEIATLPQTGIPESEPGDSSPTVTSTHKPIEDSTAKPESAEDGTHIEGSQEPLSATHNLQGSDTTRKQEETQIEAEGAEDGPQDSDSIERGLQDISIAGPQVTDSSTGQDGPVDALVNGVESEESDGEGWITPSNIKKHKAKDQNITTTPAAEPKTMQVATITSDFAMQNVLLQMNLNLLSSSMQRIRHLKTYVLRCHACFQLTKDMGKQFCSRCGKPTLLRAACTTNQNGEFKVHLKKNMQWNSRGDRYSIPKPVSGSSNGRVNIGGGGKGGGKGGWGQGLILAEDQKEYVQAIAGAARRKEKDLMDQDYLPNILSGERHRAGGRPKVGGGRNVNSKKRHD